MGESRRAEARTTEAKKKNVASHKQKTDLSQSISPPEEEILFLQRTIGNQAVGRLIKSRTLQSKSKIVHQGDIHEKKTNIVERINGPVPEVGSKSERTVSSIQVLPDMQRQPEGRSGKRMYLTGDGRMVELPPDMTAEDAARLEAEAKAAEKKLGKRPPPKSIPEVKKPAIKPEKKGKPEIKVKVEKGYKIKSKGKAPPGAMGFAPIEDVGGSEVAKYLVKRGAPVLLRGIGKLKELKQHEQTHYNATEKLDQSEKAVVVPTGESQSQSNASQVNAVSAKQPPVVDEAKARHKLQESLQENIPQTIEDVDNFKRDRKAQRMGADVMKVVQGDKNAVISTFSEMEHTPPPFPPGHKPETLPPEEEAPPTANLELGRGAVAPLQKEHTDLSHYTRESESKLKEEEITQEQLDMVDSGDLAEANREKKGIEKSAKSEPSAVQKFASQESEKVDKDLKQEEKKERDVLKSKRRASLSATSRKQKETKTTIEKKREEVASKINGIFKSAQDKVKKKLEDLEKDSMKRFEDGNAKAAREFEDNVKREIDAYKDDRYSGFFGWARRAKDWLLGMDELPRVKAIFDNNRAAFVNTISKLVDSITADNRRVIQECKDELANARQEIKNYVDKLGPDLKDTGKKAAEEMNARLDELDQSVAKKEEELQDRLKEKQKAAIKAIDEKIAKMKEAMAGALSKLGKLLLNAAKKFFTWALEKFGYTLGTIEGIIDKGVAVLKAIFTKPIQFVKNLVNAAITGFENFGLNFLKHLKDAVFEWLTGSLVGIISPERWDLKGILSVVFQMLGITYQNIRAHLVKLIPEPAVKSMETTFTLVKSLITEGPMAAWEQLKDIAGEIKDTFMDAVKDWIKWKVIEEAIKTIVGMFIPGAGFVRAIVGIYDTIVFFIKKAKDIMQMVGSFLGSIAEIAAGNITSAAEALENGLARGLKLVIDFLARFLRLEGITQKIRDAIQNIRSKVDNVIGKVAEWIVGKVKKSGKFVAEAGARIWKGLTGVGKLLNFSAGGEQHRLWIERRGKTAVVVVESAKTDLFDFLRSPDLLRLIRENPNMAETHRRASEVLSSMQPDVAQVAQWIEQAQPTERETTREQEMRLKNEGVSSKERELISLLRQLFELLSGRSTRAEAALRIQLDLTRVNEQMKYAKDQMALQQNASLRVQEVAVERIRNINQGLLNEMTTRPGRYLSVKERFDREVAPPVALLPRRLLGPMLEDKITEIPSVEDWRKEPLYGMRFTETRRDLKLITNPADRFPRAVQEILDSAQETLTEANKPGAKYGDGSTAYAAIAEQVLGSKNHRKFDVPAAKLPGLDRLHEDKCIDNNKGFKRLIGEITKLMKNDPQRRSEQVIEKLRGEIVKNNEAVTWCQEYRGGHYPDLRAWAARYRDELITLGLMGPGEKFT